MEMLNQSYWTGGQSLPPRWFWFFFSRAHKFLCCYIKYGDAFMWWHSIKLSEKVEERRYFTSEINNCFSRRFMAKLRAWQRADSQDRAVGRRLGFSAFMMVVLWSNLCLWNYPPRAVGLISSKVRATTGSTEIAWLLKGSQAEGKRKMPFCFWSLLQELEPFFMGQATTKAILSQHTWRMFLLLPANQRLLNWGWWWWKGARIRWLFFGVNSLW